MLIENKNNNINKLIESELKSNLLFHLYSIDYISRNQFDIINISQDISISKLRQLIIDNNIKKIDIKKGIIASLQLILQDYNPAFDNIDCDINIKKLIFYKIKNKFNKILLKYQNLLIKN